MAVAAAAAAAAAVAEAARQRAADAIRQRNERLRLEREERFEQAERRQALTASQAPTSQPALDMAKWKQQDYAAYEASQHADALQAFRDQEHASVPIVAPSPVAAWWQRTVENVKEAQRSVANWVDQHQAAVAIGVGVVAAITGIAIVALSGGTATPLVIAGWAALAAGGTVALGTVGLNSYFGRPLTQNLLRNAALSVGGAVATAGAWGLLTSGLATQAVLGAGNTVAGLCLRFQPACARLEPVLQAFDTGEQIWLSAQLAVQTATKDPRAPETALELQLEQIDGGVPGNTAIRELSEVGGDALEALARHGDEAAGLATTIANHGDEVVEVLDSGLIRMRPEAAASFADELRATLNTADLISARGDIQIRVWHSPTSGYVYASLPTQDVVGALDQVEALARAGQIHGPDVIRLSDIIASASAHGSGERVVLGRFGATGEFIQEAMDNGGVFFDTSEEVYRRLQRAGIDPWLVNEAFLRQQAEAGRSFEYVLRELEADVFESELSAIDLVALGDVDLALVALDLGEGSPVPARLKEAGWLLEHGYEAVVDYSAQVIRWIRP